MIPKTFVPLNFVCSVRLKDTSDPWQQRLELAQTADELRARLEDQALEVNKVEAYDFNTWLAAARQATQDACAAIESGQKYSFKENIWGGLRDYLFRLFDGKCAYCEGKRGGVTPGSVEHYRPKGRVIGADNHPGYYWLAYEVTNYLPGCTTCNGKKSNHFPLKNEDKRVRMPTDSLEEEIPLLINPYKLLLTDRHFSFSILWEQGEEFKAKLVMAKAHSPEGATTIEFLDLNREDLRTARAEVLNQVMLAIKEEFLRREKRVLKELQEGRREFSRACLAGVEEISHRGG